MRKKFLSLAVILCIIMSFIPITATATALSGNCGKEGDNVTYTLNNGKLTISGTGEMADYSDITDVPWYNNRADINSVVIESGVTSIGRYAFSYLDKLTRVDISEGVTVIGSSAFLSCSSLISLTLPSSIANINSTAFRQCENLEEITLPHNLTNIGRLAFFGCTKLTSVYVEDIASYLNISFENESSNPMYYASRLYINGKRATSIEIPDGITTIPAYAFKGCQGLNKITIPDSVTTINSYAFSECSDLKEIIIPKSVTTMQNYAFSDCASLTNVIIEEGIESIPWYAFQNCENLTSITFPNSVKKIGIDVLRGCNRLKEITLPFIGETRDSNLEYRSVFGHIFGTTNSGTPLDIEPTLQRYGTESTNTCLSAIPPTLEKVTVTDAVQIPYGAFSNCANIKEITLPKTVTTIDTNAFKGCTGLETLNFNAAKCQSAQNTFGECQALKNLNIGDDVTTIHSNLFSNCTGLNELVIGKNVSSIKDNAFENCTNITHCFIPESVTEIEKAAFKNCTSLRTVSYGGLEEQWEEIYINSTDNEPLINASRSYSASAQPTTAPTPEITSAPTVTPSVTPDISPMPEVTVKPTSTPSVTPDISPTPATTPTPEITVTKTETDTAYIFDVSVIKKYDKCNVYAAIYNENGVLTSLDKTLLEMSDNTILSIDKSENDAYVKIFVWTDTMTPVTDAEKIILK